NFFKTLGQFTVALCLPFALCAAPLSLRAATITVTDTAESGAGTLRDALATANDGDTINFALATPARIALTSGELLVAKSVNILGPGATNLAVDGNAASRVFHVTPSNTVAISGLMITNGLVSYPPSRGEGGGIYSENTTLTVSNCSVSGNSANAG